MTAMGRGLGMDLKRLAKVAAFFDETYVQTGRHAGVQLSVLRRGELVHQTTHGLADRERGTPLREDAIFRIYSMTKPLTAVAFMMLVEEGKVALDDPVERYIPSWKNLQVFEGVKKSGRFKTRPAAAPMRIVDLLRHTSGLTYHLHGQNPVDAAYLDQQLSFSHGKHDREGFIATLAGLPLTASPGDIWTYSVSSDVLGYLIEKISETPFDQFLKTRILDPLGMDDTAFQVAAKNVDRFTACYMRTPAGETILLDDPITSPYLQPPRFVSGGGGLTSTSKDYLQFLRMLLGRGELNGHRFIAPKTLDLMTANHIPGGKDLTSGSPSQFNEAIYEGVGFGLGFAVTFDQPKTLLPGSNGDFFWGGWASTYFWVDPAEDLAVLYMAQLGPSNSYANRRQLRTLVYSALTETAPRS